MEMINAATSIVRALVLYHLAEVQGGNATTIQIDVEPHRFRIRDNGRGQAIQRTVNGLPYLKLVYSQLEYPFDLEQDTPIQLHTIGISLINSLCKMLTVTVHKKEKIYTQYYEEGQLKNEEVRENLESVTGTMLEGKFNSDLLPGEINLQDLAQWLAGVKPFYSSLRVIFNERDL
jgi:DNA gyrase/topoisomerase IV subunit B